LGAGDGFMSGLLKGWLDGEDWSVALKYANACGAFAVSRHGCTPAYPSWDELQYFFDTGITTPALRKDVALEQVHWATNRGKIWPQMRVFAFDHRSQFEAMTGATPAKIGTFKTLALQAALQVADGRDGYGVLCDNRLGRNALYQAAGTGLWIGRPTELPGSRPLELEPELGIDLGQLGEWPAAHVVKQEATIKRLFAAARRRGLEFLLEVIPSKVGAIHDDTTASLIERVYGLGVFPDWWKLEPMQSDAAWAKTCAAITAHDPR